MIELGKLFTLTDEPGTITRYGRRQIETFIALQRINSDDWQAVNPTETRIYLAPLPDNWEWKWLVQQGEYRGTFPKRVANYFHKRHGLKTPDSFNTQIGNLAKTHSQTAETYTFDFTSEIDWERGDFGDQGSCYWGANSAARAMLEMNGGIAIRFYDVNNEGFARAWLVPFDDAYFIFNGYGLQTIEIAQVFARFMGLDYSRVTLENRGSSSGTLYINSGHGYVIGTTARITDIKHHDFDFEGMVACYSCDEKTLISESRNFHGYTYCLDCFDNLFTTCENCDRVCERDDAYVTADRQLVCERCLSNSYTECYGCYEFYRHEDTREFKERDFCHNCLN